jgi:hypothetical protein
VVNLKENVEIVVQSGIKQRIANWKKTKMVVRTVEITTVFRKMQAMALTALIVVIQVILEAIVTNRKINPTVTVVQVTMTVMDTAFLIPIILHVQQSPWKIILQMTCGFLIVEPVVITTDPWKG